MTGHARGQTSIDFLVGMSVFLLTVAFVFATLPNTFAPFTGGDNADLLTADRVASHLAEGTLARPDRPNVLNEPCTEEFFDADGNVGDCSYETDANDLRGAVGVRSNVGVNVTVEPVETGQKFGAGPTPPSGGSVVAVSRLVSLGGDEYTLFVRMW